MTLSVLQLTLSDVLRFKPRWEHLVVNVRDHATVQLVPLAGRRQAAVDLPGIEYVGRRNVPYGLPKHPLANPFALKDYLGRGVNQATPEHRWRCLADYWHWLDDLAPHYLAGCLAKLRGKQLACWCAPELCHAHVLAVLANQDPIEDDPTQR
jgi:hypothetical protein